MKQCLLAFFLVLVLIDATSQNKTTDQKDPIINFILNVKTGNIDKLKSLVIYPLKRDYPLPDINNEDEFVNRYNEVFDDTLISLIINSDIENDWSAVGWRGVMLFHGDLWLNTEGELIAVNYQSSTEKILRDELINTDKDTIHESLQDFKEPILKLQTEKFNIRIDKLSDGSIRYSCWSINVKENTKPDLVLKNGTWIPDGSGGNSRYEFVNGNYKYECAINVVGSEETPPASLTVYKGEKEILYQAARIIRY